MKKVMIVLTALCLLVAGGGAIEKVSAEQAPKLDVSYTLYVDANGNVTVPEVENAPEGAAYTVSVYRFSDTAFASPLYENVSGSFRARHTGKFRFVYDLAGGTEEDKLITTVEDNVAPVLNVEGLKESYFKDEKTAFTVTYSDNFEETESLIYSLRVWYEDAPYTTAIGEDGQVTFDIKGNYKLIFTVRDAAGNTATQEFSFRVEVNGFDFSNLIPVLAVLLMLAMFLLPIVIVVKSEFTSKKKEKKK